MQTSREDVGIAIRSAFLQKGTQQRFSLFVLVLVSVAFLFFETIETKPLNYIRSIFKDVIYRSSVLISSPSAGFRIVVDSVKDHVNIYNKYEKLKGENKILKEKIFDPDFLLMENNQLRKLIEEQVASKNNLISSRVMLDKQSPYLNSFILNSGTNKDIKNGMAVLDGPNFIGRIVDVNFFSSRVLLISDLNSRIPVLIQPSGHHAILAGHGTNLPTLEFLPEDHTVQEKNKVYTSGKEGIFASGIPVGEVKINNGNIVVSLFSDLSQITFVNINLGDLDNK